MLSTILTALGIALVVMFVLKLFYPETHAATVQAAKDLDKTLGDGIRNLNEGLRTANKAIAKELKAIDDEIGFSDEDLDAFLNNNSKKISNNKAITKKPDNIDDFSDEDLDAFLNSIKPESKGKKG